MVGSQVSNRIGEQVVEVLGGTVWIAGLTLADAGEDQHVVDAGFDELILVVAAQGLDVGSHIQVEGSCAAFSKPVAEQRVGGGADDPAASVGAEFLAGDSLDKGVYSDYVVLLLEQAESIKRSQSVLDRFSIRAAARLCSCPNRMR